MLICVGGSDGYINLVHEREIMQSADFCAWNSDNGVTWAQGPDNMNELVGMSTFYFLKKKRRWYHINREK